MSTYYQRGRADAARGVYDPPNTSIFDSKAESNRILDRKEEYREGYHDKKREMERGKKKSGGCFVTTACVKMLGLPDDCREMTVLRNFRDSLLKTEAVLL